MQSELWHVDNLPEYAYVPLLIHPWGLRRGTP